MKYSNLMSGAAGLSLGAVVTLLMRGTPLPTLITLAALFSGTSGIITAGVIGGKASAKVQDGERKLSNLEIELDRIEKINKQQATETTDLNQKLTQALKALADVRTALDSERQSCNVLKIAIAEKDSQLNQFQTLNNQLADQVEDLQAETVAWEQTFTSRLETEAIALANTRYHEFRSGELAANDEVLTNAFKQMDRLIAWGHKVAESHQAKRTFIENLTRRYNQNLEDAGSEFDKQIESYTEQIELLNLKVARLQRELAGELLEPELIDAQYDLNQRVANDIAKAIFRVLGIPLKVCGVNRKSDGAVDCGYGYSRNLDVARAIDLIKRASGDICNELKLHRITSIRKLEVTDCLVITFRLEPVIKDDEVGLMLGSAEEFISYITSHPIRYRLIADPGVGKTPTTAVMISEIIKAGCTRGNTGKGEKVPHTLVSVSYPGAVGSLKDGDNYPLKDFLKYGDTTAAIKSFEDCLIDGEFRAKHPVYAAEFFHIRVWDEFDNTLNSCSDPYQAGEKIKKILKQFGHNNIGWIVSGQSVMTKQIPGFTNDDRALFTEIIIGIPKIRKYLDVYGKGRNSEANLAKLNRNLDAIEEWVEHKNELVTDDARLLRVALVVDSRSPKLYLLPNLDLAQFDTNLSTETRRLSDAAKSRLAGDTFSTSRDHISQDVVTASTLDGCDQSRNLTMGGRSEVATLPHCPHCGSSSLTSKGVKEYQCKDCKKRFVRTKAIWK